MKKLFILVFAMFVTVAIGTSALAQDEENASTTAQPEIFRGAPIGYTDDAGLEAAIGTRGDLGATAADIYAETKYDIAKEKAAAEAESSRDSKGDQ